MKTKAKDFLDQMLETAPLPLRVLYIICFSLAACLHLYLSDPKETVFVKELLTAVIGAYVLYLMVTFITGAITALLGWGQRHLKAYMQLWLEIPVK